jgi:glycosyltransferase involved in cell wall biosynthesis
MRIGIMLRSLDEKGGVGVYTRYLTQELLDLDRHNEYVLFYRHKSHLGHFGHHGNLTERILPIANKLVWDQIAVPYSCWREHVDVVLHPKFTVPLFAPCKSVMVLHGAGWFMPEFKQFWKSWDLKYVRLMMPIYCKRAAAVIAVSQITTEIFTDLFSLPAGKIRTVYFGPGKSFARVDEAVALRQVKDRYDLPDRFIFTLAKYGDGGRKNLEGILTAYQRVHGKIPHRLVVGGKDGHRFREDYDIPVDGYGKDILFAGWIEQEDLPVFYSLADLFLYPSNVEAFPIPLTEAMACGTPIVTSDANGLKEIVGDAALLVNPRHPDEIAQAVEQVLSDPDLRNTLSSRALERAKMFRWENCARETLDILESLGPRQKLSRAG